MGALATWTCGCGARVASGPCPVCGWTAAAPGQPDRSPTRWSPVLAGLIAVSLVVGGTSLLVDSAATSPVSFHAVGHAIAADDHGLASVPNRPVAADLSGLVPRSIAGWRMVTSAMLTGSFDQAAASKIGRSDPASIQFERNRLQDAGVAAARGVAFVSPARDFVVGVIVLPARSAAAAQAYVDNQAALLGSPGAPASVNVPGEVGWRYPVPGAGDAIDVVYRVDQLIVHEYVAAAHGSVSLSELTPIHAAVTAALAT